MKYLKATTFLLIVFAFSLTSMEAQDDRWQQSVDYKMDVDFDVSNHQFNGTQKLKYTNNSPDALRRVFYHLYFNAFQPGSMMDIRSKMIKDGDPRIANKISVLGDDNMGKQYVSSLKLNGADCKFEHVGTILEVELPKAIQPGTTVTLDMKFNGQVPDQIRRSGRNNSEGIDYSMSQWYPKLCEYDYQGWHANPYIAREYHGVWGEFDVTINIDKDYIVGATGFLDGERNKKMRSDGKKSWRFTAENVHDFVWAADPDYKHVVQKSSEGIDMHFYYQPGESTDEVWSRLPDIMDKAFIYINKNFGKYPYSKYSFIQGGDGGMEYPMATLITGERSLGSLVGVSVHELMHSWYQMVLGSNESLYAWMDEGFTSYASSEVMNHLAIIGALPGAKVQDNPQAGYTRGYVNFAKSGAEEALSTHSDHFISNQAYSVAAYVKGCVFIDQLSYIIGKEDFRKGMIKYYDTWKFKHPNPNDFIRIMEKQSGIELDWYKEYMVNTTHTIDYKISGFKRGKRKTSVVSLEKVGVFPMPLDVVITLRSGKKIVYNIPLRIMRGNKPKEVTTADYKVLEDWPWVNPEYEFTIPIKSKNVMTIEIDPSGRLADADLTNNQFSNAE